MRVAIVGAGIGGLALAAGIGATGAEVNVFEKSRPGDTSGLGLTLFPNGFRALDSLGLKDPVREACGDSAPPANSGLRRPDGRWLVRGRERATRGVRVVDRAALHGALRAGLPEDVVAYERRVEWCAGREITFEDGSVVGDFDLIVGADGLRSIARRSVWGPDDPGTRTAGYFACRGITEHPVDVDSAGETWGRGLRFGIAPLADGRIYWFAVGNGAVPASEDAWAWADSAFAGWHHPVGEIVRVTAPEAVQSLPIETIAAPLRDYVRGPVVLLGDAAHAMTPNLGQGANQALEDAAELCRRLEPLAGGPGSPAAHDLASGLRGYDRARRRRSQWVARAAGAVGQIAQAENPLVRGARDLVLTAVPA